MTRPGLDLPMGQMEGRSVGTLCLSSSHLYSGNKWTNYVPLSSTSKWVLCPVEIEWSLSNCLRAGLDYWASHEQLFLCPERTWRKGRTADLKKSRPV